jgi:hypothetical protein
LVSGKPASGQAQRRGEPAFTFLKMISDKALNLVRLSTRPVLVTTG